MQEVSVSSCRAPSQGLNVGPYFVFFFFPLLLTRALSLCDKALVEETTEVADVRSSQKLSLCTTELMPVGSNTDTPLTKVASGDTSEIIKKGGKKCASVRAAEK